MKMQSLSVVILLVTCLLMRVRAVLDRQCLDQISRGRHCCTPSAFLKLDFKLNLNSAPGGCDPPSYLDEGVRLEVRRPGYDWEPIRFYTATMESQGSNSLITVLSSGSHVSDENNITFPLYQSTTTETFSVSEYLCGAAYYTPGTQYRWLQYFNSLTEEGRETWSLGDITLTYHEHSTLCSASLSRYSFTDLNGTKLSNYSLIPPDCDPVLPESLSVYFNQASDINGSTQRGVILTPMWWNSNCSQRTNPGCELSEECNADMINDDICSVGRGLTCQCNYPQVAGNNKMCYFATVGFERIIYDTNEGQTLNVCVAVLNGTLVEESISVRLSTTGGNIQGKRTLTLSPGLQRSCYSVSDNPGIDETECYTASLTITGGYSSAAYLTQDTATLCFIDTNVVNIEMESNTVLEGRGLSVTIRNSQDSDSTVFRQTTSVYAGTIIKTATSGVDYSGFSISSPILPRGSLEFSITGKVDYEWERDEVFLLRIDNLPRGPPYYNRTITIIDSNKLQVGFNDVSYTVNEDIDFVNVCVTVHGNISSNTNLLLAATTIPGSAEEILDYQGVHAVMEFNSSVSIQCVELTIVDDIGVEGNENMMMSLSLISKLQNINITRQTLPVTIMDNDFLEVGFTNSLYTVFENSSSVMVCCEVKRGSLEFPIHLTITQTDAPLSSLEVSMTPTKEEGCTNIAFDDDKEYEDTEYIGLTLSLKEPQHSAVNLSLSTAVIAIYDDDALTVGVVVNSTQSESSGTFDVCVEVLSGKLAVNISFSLSSQQDSALKDVDYIGPHLSSVSLNGNISRHCVPFSTVNDMIYEDNEFFTVSLSPTGPTSERLHISPNQYKIYIEDDDDVDVGFVSSSYHAAENSSSIDICVEVKRGQLGVAISVRVTSNSRDHEDMILGERNGSVCIKWEINDDLAWETDEVVQLSLGVIDHLTRVNISTSLATLVIIDNDVVSVGIVNSEYYVREDDDTLSVCVRIGPGSVLGADLVLLLQTKADTAKGNEDYENTQKQLQFPPTVLQQCTVIRITNDEIFEDNEDLTISLSNVNKTGRVNITTQFSRIFITDDDRIQVGFQKEQYIIHENQSNASVCVEVTGSLATAVSFKVATLSVNASDVTDYLPIAKTITFSEETLLQCIHIHVINDNTLEQRETLILNILSDTLQDRIDVVQQSAVVIITDDDSLTIAFKQNYTVIEDDNDVSVCVAILSGHLGQDLQLYLDTIDESASDMADFEGYVQRVITLTPDETEVCIVVLITDDELYEEDEVFLVSLSLVDNSSIGAGIVDGLATVTIVNDDEISVALERSYYHTNESAGFIDVCASVDGGLGANVTLAVIATEQSYTAATSDYNISSTLNFTPSKKRNCVNFTIINDDIVEAIERIAISLSKIGTSNMLHVSNQSLNIDVSDDDVAVVGLHQNVTPDKSNGTVRHVEICAVTNSTLERQLELSLTTELSTKTERNITRGNLVLSPNSALACIRFNITIEQKLIFYVSTNESAEIINPNGTIVGEPSFEDIVNLLSGTDFNIQDVVEALDEIVESLIKNGQIASYEFSETFIDIVSQVLDKSSDQALKPGDTDDSHPGTSLLVTLDKFALQSFNSSLPPITSDNTKINVIEVEADKVGDNIIGVAVPGGDEIKITAAALTDYNIPVRVGSYHVRNVSGILPISLSNNSDAELVTPVISSALWCGDRMCRKLRNEGDLVHISLSHRRMKDDEEPRCVFYDLSSNEWSDEGCRVSNETTSSKTVCICNHLTHFAVMLSPKNSVNEKHAYNLQLIGYVGISISLTCLLTTIIIFSCYRSLWSMRNYIHINLCVSLFLSQLLFVAGVDKIGNQIVCQTIAIFLHYGFLVTFMWMLMEGVVLYVALVRVFVTKPRRYMLGFTITSYGVPLVYMALVVPLGFLLPHAPHYGGETCWLKYDTNFIWAMITPVILIIMANIGFFFMAVYIIWKQQARKKLSMNQIQKAKHWLKVSVSLLAVMGISWIVGVITFHEALLFVSYIFTIIVAFQGAIMFIMFVILSKQVRVTLKKSLVRNVIMKSEFLSDHFSEFTRSTQAGYSQSYSTASTKNTTVNHGIQLGTFLASPANPAAFAKIKEDMTDTISPSPPGTSLPSPSPPSTPYASSCNSPDPCKSYNIDQGLDVDITDGDEKPSNSFTVIFVSNNDKDSGRGSPESDPICTPPPDKSTIEF